MSEKIAVHCPTKELWDKVEDKAIREGKQWSSGHREPDYWGYYKDNICISLASTYLMYGIKTGGCYEKEGYTIISAKDYLKEGGEEVEFKVGDRVECIVMAEDSQDRGRQIRSDILVGSIRTISRLVSTYREPHIAFDEGIYVHPSNLFKLANNQTKIIKEEKGEEKMKKVIINEIVDAVFDKKEDMKLVQEQLGSEIEIMFEGCIELGTIWTTKNKEEVLARAHEIQKEKESCS